jgi:ubiquinone/menaquinone biosynthesis C-methylase UbiE
MEDVQTDVESWQISGSSPAAYEKYLVPGFFKPWAETLTALVSPAPGSDVLDVACGTGIVARTVSSTVKKGVRVTGLDNNPEMLKHASMLSKRSGLEIDWQQGEANQLPFKERRFDYLFCQQGMQFFPEPQQALKEMHRVLKPGGRLALNIIRSIDYHPAFGILANELEKHIGETAGNMMRAPFPEWDQKTIRSMVEDAGFENLSLRIEIISMRFPSPEEFLRQEAVSSPLAGEMESLETDIRNQLIYDLNRSLESYQDDNGIVFPMETVMVVADKQK